MTAPTTRPTRRTTKKKPSVTFGDFLNFKPNGEFLNTKSKTKKKTKKILKAKPRTPSLSRRGRPASDIKYKRRTFMFDDRTDIEVMQIQNTLRATTASEAVRYTVRKLLELMTHAGAGGRIRIEFPRNRQPLLLDIPKYIPVPVEDEHDED